MSSTTGKICTEVANYHKILSKKRKKEEEKKNEKQR